MHFPNKKPCCPKHTGLSLFYVCLRKYILLPCFSSRRLAEQDVVSSLLSGRESEKAPGRKRKKKTLNAREREDNLGRQVLKVKDCDNPYIKCRGNKCLFRHHYTVSGTIISSHSKMLALSVLHLLMDVD